MAVHLNFLLILTGLTGIHSITTVSKMSVKAGDSVTIPCLYDSQYTNHVKYLCKGSTWSSCSYAVKTNQQNSGKFSISDDKSQRIFTVTIKDLTVEDTDNYWCAVEINRGTDVREYFQLLVTRDTPRLYVDHQEITGFNGGEVTINCQHRNRGEIAWCRLGSSCVTTSSRSIDGTRVTISRSVPNVYTVTMSGLRTESSGWYWCAKGDLQMPVHVTVTEQPATNTPGLYVDHQEITGFKGDSITINCHSNSGEIAWCRLGSSCVTTSSGSIDGTRVTISMSVPDVFTVTMSGLRTESSGWYWCVRGNLQMPVHLTVTERPANSKLL
ncbi:polymeric immunoglobulin receptor-like [Sebastes fasciatus]|uniref:polymeric immunoglobulin receptor-like n=1 Tax=Sebastes fasciatus TaxID=394691 RepID=UPI003D9F9E36